MADDTKRKKRPELTSPKGVFKFPKLHEPDTKFKAEGEYSVKLVLSESDPVTQAFLAKLTPLYDEALAEAETAFAQLPIATRKKLGSVKPNPFYSQVFDSDENPTGDIEIKFGLKASGEYKRGPKAGQKYTNKVVVFDASGKVMASPPAIWGGTVGKVSSNVSGYFIPGTGMAGMSLNIQAVQVIDLVTSGGARSASGYGFGAEDGYTQDDDAPAADAAFSDETRATDDNADF